jgi:alpha-galactosidase
VGPSPAHATGRAQSLDFRCAVALFGHMGVEADLRRMSDAERATLAGWLALHKTWRAVLHGGSFHQGESTGGATWWLAREADRALLGVFTLVPPDAAHEPPLRLPPLDDTGLWRVRLLRSAGLARARSDAPSTWLDALRGDGVLAGGAELARVGLPLQAMNPESAWIVSFERVVGA